MYRYAISYDTFWTTLEQSNFPSLGRPGFWTGQTQVAPSKCFQLGTLLPARLSSRTAEEDDHDRRGGQIPRRLLQVL